MALSKLASDTASLFLSACLSRIPSATKDAKEISSKGHKIASTSVRGTAETVKLP